jgi:hypothetical protein
MQPRWWMLYAAMSCLLLFSERGFARSPQAPYRVLQLSAACVPCGVESYVVIDSSEKVEKLYRAAKEKCPASQEPDRWRDAIFNLKIDFRNEAIVTLYEVIGTGGKPSLQITGPVGGVVKANISWDSGPPPHVPIATATCMSFAVVKSAVKQVDVMPGGVLNKKRETLSLPVLAARPGETVPDATPRR